MSKDAQLDIGGIRKEFRDGEKQKKKNKVLGGPVWRHL